MKLKTLLKVIDPYQDLQIINARTNEVYTPVTYINASDSSRSTILEHENEDVHGVSSGIDECGTPYIIITLNRK